MLIEIVVVKVWSHSPRSTEGTSRSNVWATSSCLGVWTGWML